MSEMEIDLELEKIFSIEPLQTDGAYMVIAMHCILTADCARFLEREVLHSLRGRNLTDAGIGTLADYINHIGFREFNKQLAAIGYTILPT